MRRVLSEADLREFRDRVCGVATELLAEMGCDGFNMRELAGRLGVSAMTTYRYFDSKNDIFAALRVQAFGRLADRLENGVDEQEPPFEQHVAFCRSYVDFAREEPIRYRLMYEFSQPQIARPAELADAEGRVFQAFLDQVSLFANCGESESCTERVAQNLWAALHGFAALIASGTFRDCELEELLLDMVRRFAGPSGRSIEIELKSRDLGADHQPLGARRAKGGLTSSGVPVTAAE